MRGRDSDSKNRDSKNSKNRDHKNRDHWSRLYRGSKMGEWSIRWDITM